MSKTLHADSPALERARDPQRAEPAKEIRSAVDDLIEKAKEFSERSVQDAESDLRADFLYD